MVYSTKQSSGNGKTGVETRAETRHEIAKIFSSVGGLEFRFVIRPQDIKIMMKPIFMTYATKRNKTKVAPLTSLWRFSTILLKLNE